LICDSDIITQKYRASGRFKAWPGIRTSGKNFPENLIKSNKKLQKLWNRQ